MQTPLSISKMIKRLSLVTLTVLISTNSTFTTHAANFWVYFGTYTAGASRGIYAARLDSVGKLSRPTLVATTVNPSFLAVDSKHRYLYAVNEINGSTGETLPDVIAYAINAENGNLTKLNEQAVRGEALCHVEVDASDRTVLVASYGGGSVATFPVQIDGSLGKSSSFIQHHGSSVTPLNQKGPHAHCIVTDQASHFALACDLGLDQILIYKLDPKARTITPNNPAFVSMRPGLGPRHLAFHPNGKFVYVISEMDCSITAFNYDSKRGSLSEIQNISSLTTNEINYPAISGAEIAVHPNGKFLYTSTRGLDVINVFSIHKKGLLSRIESISSGGKTPRNFNLDPTGRFLIAANQNSDDVVVFRVDPRTGRLSPTGQTERLGNPSCVVFARAK